MLTPTPDMDETLLTAFALGELDSHPEERDRVAAHLETDDEARRFVDEVRDSAGLISGALGMELADGLSEFHHETIERRLRELDWEPQPLRFRSAMPANGRAKPVGRPWVARRGARFRRWLPTLASLAASIAIVAGGVALFLRFDRYDTVASNDKSGSNSSPAPLPMTNVTPTAPDSMVMVDDQQRSAETDSASGVAGKDEGPVEGMVDPKSVKLHQTAKKTPAKSSAAVASSAPKKSAPGKPAEAAVAASTNNARLKTMRSADAVEAKRMSVVSAYVASGQKSAEPARGPKTVNASPARDGVPAAEKTAKSGVSKDVPKLFENPFRAAAERSHSTFRIPPHDWSYKHVEASLVDDNRLPPTSQARVEELLNHFAYAYPAPADGAAVAVKVEVATCPWDIAHRLARITVQARGARPGEGAKPVASELTTGVKFNPMSVNAWRLIGYETGDPAPGGSFPPADLAAGAAVTALYEIAPVPGSNPSSASPAHLFTVSIRYRDTASAQRETVKAVVASDTGAGFDRADEDFHFASAVAAFGMLLRDCKYAGSATYADVIRWATAGKGADESGQRAEFIDLARRARDLSR